MYLIKYLIFLIVFISIGCTNIDNNNDNVNPYKSYYYNNSSPHWNNESSLSNWYNDNRTIIDHDVFINNTKNLYK